jgi:hypothetical protein
MKIEDELKSKVEYNKSTRVVLNLMYTQNVITESFNEILKPYDI